jgi:hypothetical protein
MKTTISTVNSTLQTVNQNERTLENGPNKLLNYNAHAFQKLEEIGNVNLLHEQLRLVHRGIDECQHSFES